MNRPLVHFRLNPVAAALALYLFLPAHANATDCDENPLTDVCTISTASTQVNGGYTTPLADGHRLIITSPGGSIRSSGIAINAVDQADVVVEVYGTVETTGDGGHAIDLGNATNARLVVDGNVTTAGNWAYGVSLEGSANPYVLVNGIIETTGTGPSDALRLVDSTDATVVVNGTVRAIGSNNGHGINASNVCRLCTPSSNHSIIINGLIETAGGSDFSPSYGLTVGESSSVKINIGGKISTTGYRGYGIYLGGSNNLIDVSGSIETSNFFGFGIQAGGFNFSNQTILINGSVKTSGGFAWGVTLDESSTVRVDGSIYTTGRGASALRIFGSNNIIEISGLVKATGDNANAVDLSSTLSVKNKNKLIIYESGAIETVAVAINGASQENLEILVDGRVSTTGRFGHALDPGQSSNSRIIINGEVSTAGNGAYGVGLERSTGADVLINGTVLTTGTNDGTVRAEAVRLDNATNAVLVLNGEIRTTGAGAAIGINAGGVSSGNNNLTINGQINTAGAAAHGLIVGNTSVLQVNGSIATKGADAHAVKVDGSGNSIDVSGSLHATGAGANAIENSSGTNNVYTLRKGSVIVGDIVTNEGGNTLRFNHAASKSYVFETTGDWILEDMSGRTVVKGSAMAAGVGRAETADEMLFERTQLFLQSMDRGQMRRDLAGDSALWVDPYAFDSKRSASNSDPTVMKYGSNGYGLTLGYDFQSFGLKAQAIGNIQRGKLKIDDNTQSVNNTSWLVGLRLPSFYEEGPVSFSAMAFAGRNQYSSDSQVLTNMTSTGAATYSSSYGSTQLLFGLGAKYATPLTQSTDLSVKADLYLSKEYMESYQEGPYFSWNNRTLSQVSAFLEIGVDHYLTDPWLIQAKFGANTQTLLSGKNTNYSINNTQVTFSGGQTNDTGFYAMLGTQYRVKDNARVGLSVWYGQSKNSVKNIQGTVEAKFLF